MKKWLKWISCLCTLALLCAPAVSSLAEAAEAGYEAYVLFLIQMKGCGRFTPNDATDGAFAAALRQAAARGVRVLCYDCLVTEDSMTADGPVPVELR